MCKKRPKSFRISLRISLRITPCRFALNGNMEAFFPPGSSIQWQSIFRHGFRAMISSPHTALNPRENNRLQEKPWRAQPGFAMCLEIKFYWNLTSPVGYDCNIFLRNRRPPPNWCLSLSVWSGLASYIIKPRWPHPERSWLAFGCHHMNPTPSQNKERVRASWAKSCSDWFASIFSPRLDFDHDDDCVILTEKNFGKLVFGFRCNVVVVFYTKVPSPHYSRSWDLGGGPTENPPQNFGGKI